MAAFLDIFKLLIAFNLAIGFFNAACVQTGMFDTQYMKNTTIMEYKLSDMEDSLPDKDSGIMSYIDSALTLFQQMLTFLKDFALGSVFVYRWLKDNFGCPDAIAIPLQTIVAVSWFVFFAQIISRDSWRVKE